MEKDKKVIIGFKTIILGLCLYIVELFFLPIFGAFQTYPLIFVLTGIIIVLGIAFIIWGYKEKK